MTETQQTRAVEFDTDDFQKDVIERSHTIPVVVDFWAEWCAPCKILGPTLEKLARASDGRWVLAKVDTEKHRKISAQYNIRNIPNVKLIIDGKVSDDFVGALPERAIVDWLSKAIPGKSRAQVETARQLLADGRPSDARQLLEPIAAAESANEPATVLLAHTYLGSDPGRAVDMLEGVGRGSESHEEAEAIRTLAGLFARLASGDRLPEAPVSELYGCAIGRARSRNYAAALDAFIEVIRRDRGYDDDGARKACIAMFQLLGEDDPITKDRRRAFGSALY